MVESYGIIIVHLYVDILLNGLLLFRFQEESELRGCNPRDFQMALEEALLADQGFTEKLMQDIHMAAGSQTFDDSVYRWVEEAAGSSQYLDHVAPSQASFSLLGVSFSSMCIIIES